MPVIHNHDSESFFIVLHYRGIGITGSPGRYCYTKFYLVYFRRLLSGGSAIEFTISKVVKACFETWQKVSFLFYFHYLINNRLPKFQSENIGLIVGLI